MEHKVEIYNRGDMAVSVMGNETDVVLNPGDRVAFDVSEGLGIGPMVVQDNASAPTPGDDIGGEHAHDPIPSVEVFGDASPDTAPTE